MKLSTKLYIISVIWIVGMVVFWSLIVYTNVVTMLLGVGLYIMAFVIISFAKVQRQKEQLVEKEKADTLKASSSSIET
jgi:hypothetical protein